MRNGRRHRPADVDIKTHQVSEKRSEVPSFYAQGQRNGTALALARQLLGDAAGNWRAEGATPPRNVRDPLFSQGCGAVVIRRSFTGLSSARKQGADVGTSEGVGVVIHMFSAEAGWRWFWTCRCLQSGIGGCRRRCCLDRNTAPRASSASGSRVAWRAPSRRRRLGRGLRRRQQRRRHRRPVSVDQQRQRNRDFPAAFTQ